MYIFFLTLFSTDFLYKTKMKKKLRENVVEKVPLYEKN